MVPRLRLRIQPRGREPPEGQRGIHEGQLRLRVHPPRHTQKVREHLPRDAVLLGPGLPLGPLRRQRIRAEQEGGRGPVLHVLSRNGCQGAGLQVPEPLRQVVPSELQLCGSHLLPQPRQRPPYTGQRPFGGT